MPWVPALFSNRRADEEAKAKDSRRGLNALLPAVAQLPSLPPDILALTSFSVGAASTVLATFAVRRYFRRIRNTDWITPDLYAKKRWIKGRVLRVGDADNFHLYHTPGIGWRWPLKFRRIPSAGPEAKDETIRIRIAGIDAPEGGFFGKERQPYWDESLAWLKDQVLDKTVYCQLVERERFGRALAVVHLKPRFLPGSLFEGDNLAMLMLKAGWAVTYEQSGADYGKWTKEDFQKLEAEAMASRQGMWQNGKGGESPAAYKRRHAAAGGVDKANVGLNEPRAAQDSQEASEQAKAGFFRRLLTAMRK